MSVRVPAASATVHADGRTLRGRVRPGRWALAVVLSLLAVTALVPLVFMSFAAFRTQADWAVSKVGLPTTLDPQAFVRAWQQGQIGRTFVNSVIVTAGAVGLSVLVAAMAGYAFAKLRWRLAIPTFFFVLGWMAIPPLMMMVPIYVLMVDLGLVDTYWSAIFLYTALNTPFNAYLMTAFFNAVPDELVEAARVDGASVHRIFASILVPLSVPALATLVIFNALYVWNEFAFALLLLRDDSVRTLTVGVVQMQGRFFFDYPTLMAGLLITTVPMVIVYLVFQRYLVRAIAVGALK